MRRAALAAAICCASAAAADDRAAAVGRMLKAQADALIASNEEALEQTLAKDALVSLGLGRPVADFTMQSDLTEPTKIAWGTRRIGWAGTCGWVSAEATFTNPPHPEQLDDPTTTRTRHWVALVVPDGKRITTNVMSVALTTPDKDQSSFAYMSRLPIIAKPSPLVALLANPSELLAHLSSDPSTTVFGSAPRDRAFGPAAAKKLLAGWKQLKLDIVGPEKPGDSSYEQREVVIGECAAAFARVRLQRGPAKHVVYEGFLIAKRVGARWEVVAASYGAD